MGDEVMKYIEKCVDDRDIKTSEYDDYNNKKKIIMP